MQRHLAEPDDVRPDLSATGAAFRYLVLVRIAIDERRPSARLAAALEKVPMDVQDARGACLFVQVVDVLGADQEPVADRGLQLGERDMGRVRFLLRRRLPPRRIKGPHQIWIAAPRFGCRDVFDTYVVPHAVRVPEGRNPALGADASARQDKHAVLWTNLDHARSTPNAFCISPAMSSVRRRNVSSLSASTITRASASVPEYRTTTRPQPSSSDSALRIAVTTAANSSSGRFSRTRMFLIVCGNTFRSATKCSSGLPERTRTSITRSAVSRP